MTFKDLNPLSPYLWAVEERKKGIQELAGKSQNNPRIVWYHAFTTLKATDDETPWCSAFMCACAESNGYKSTRSAAAKSWLDYGEEGTGEVGDIAIFKRVGGYHVAFINSQYRKGDRLIEVLGGNQRDSISVAKYKSENLVAIRRFPARL